MARAVDLQTELDTLVPRLLAEHDVPGAQVALLAEGRIVASGAWGVAEAATDRPVTPETVFETGSLSKPVFACLTLRMALEGGLDLDAPLVPLLPEPVGCEDPRLGRVTARHVLSHTSGLPNWRPGRFTDRPGSLVLDFEPGTRFQYSGEGYQLLQGVLEALAGEELSRYASRTLLAPLGMDSSGFLPRPDFAGRSAVGYTREGSAVGVWDPPHAFAAASLQGTALDLAAFAAALLDPRPGAVVSPAVVALLERRETSVAPGIAWGLGCAIEYGGAAERLFHWGDTRMSFKSWIMCNRRARRGLVALANGARGLRICRDVAQAFDPGPQTAFRFEMLHY